MSLLNDIKALENERDSQIARWYERSLANASTDGVGSVATMSKAQENMQDATEQTRALTATGDGSTDKAVALQKQVNANSYTNSLRDLSTSLASQRQQIDNQYLQSQQSALQERINQKKQKQANIAQAASGVVSAGLGLVGTAIGGPLGGAVGSAVGQAVGGAMPKPSLTSPTPEIKMPEIPKPAGIKSVDELPLTKPKTI